MVYEVLSLFLLNPLVHLVALEFWEPKKSQSRFPKIIWCCCLLLFVVVCSCLLLFVLVCCCLFLLLFVLVCCVCVMTWLISCVFVRLMVKFQLLKRALKHGVEEAPPATSRFLSCSQVLAGPRVWVQRNFHCAAAARRFCYGSATASVSESTGAHWKAKEETQLPRHEREVIPICPRVLPSHRFSCVQCKTDKSARWDIWRAKAQGYYLRYVVCSRKDPSNDQHTRKPIWITCCFVKP